MSGMKSRYEPFIDGACVETAGDTFATYDPSTGAPLAEIARGTADLVDQAVRAADGAFADWRATKPSERGRVLSRIAAAIRDNADFLAKIETLDNGQALRQSFVEVELAARYFEFFGGAADKVHGTTIPLGPGYVSYTTQEPFGVVGMIFPWHGTVPRNDHPHHTERFLRGVRDIPRAERDRRPAHLVGCAAEEFEVSSSELNLHKGLAKSLAGSMFRSWRESRRCRGSRRRSG